MVTIILELGNYKKFFEYVFNHIDYLFTDHAIHF